LQNRETRLNTVFFCAFLLEYKKISKYFKNTLLFIWITFINVVSLYQQKKQFIFIFNSQQQLFIIMDKFIFSGNEVIATDAQNNVIFNKGQQIVLAMIIQCRGKHTGKYTVINCVGLSKSEICDAISAAKNTPAIKLDNLLFAERYAEMILRVMFNNELCALEAFADLLNAALHTDIANAAQADAAQCEVEQAISENAPIDFVQVYIDGKPNDWASAEVAKYCLNYFLNPDLAVNTLHTFNGAFLYLEQTILDTCFDHQNGVWEFWANPAFPDEKTILMIYLSTQPIKARKKPRYPHESDYFDYANGGDDYTANEVLDF